MADAATKPKRKRTSHVDPNEGPEAKFRRLFNQRANPVLDILDRLGTLADKNTYPASDAKVMTAFGKIVREKLDRLDAAFGAGKSPAKAGFDAGAI